MKENKSGWQFPKALEIIKCKEGNKEFMKERPARRPFGNTVLICEFLVWCRHVVLLLDNQPPEAISA